MIHNEVIRGLNILDVFLFWKIWIDFKINIILQIYKIKLLKYWERNSISLSSEGIVLLTFGCLGLDVVGWLGGLTNDAVAVVIMSDPWNTKVCVYTCDIQLSNPCDAGAA